MNRNEIEKLARYNAERVRGLVHTAEWRAEMATLQRQFNEGTAIAANRVSVLNERGEWVPAIPLPHFGMRKACDCGRRFWTLNGYRGHYALEHILGLSDFDARADSA